MDNYICIITGPIGAGKSYLCDLLKELGFDVLDADILSNQVLSSKSGQQFLKENFQDSFTQGQLNREQLSKIVFSDRNKLDQLENYIHPKVNKMIKNWIESVDGYGFIEVSVPKVKQEQYKTIVVNAPEEIRIKRLLKRGMEIDDIKRRISVQKDNDWWSSLGHNIENINPESFKENVIDLLKEWDWLVE